SDKHLPLPDCFEFRYHDSERLSAYFDIQVNFPSRVIAQPRYTREYVDGVEQFIDFLSTTMGTGCILFALVKSVAQERFKRDMTYSVILLAKPFPEGYTVWTRHGETIE
ncbi:hypothetical protein LINPERHAP1_LOCUS10632, partial [Linum perenne]